MTFERVTPAAQVMNGYRPDDDELTARAGDGVGDPFPIGWKLPPPITREEWKASALAPRCIVDNYLFADVACLVAPGGTGKTTLELFEAIHIALGLPLYGHAIRCAGPVMIITAEDSRERLVARLRLLSEALQLTEEQVGVVMRDVMISDVSGEGLKLTTLAEDVVTPSVMVDLIVEALKQVRPVLVIFDPAISFGIGEARVNDAEQGLIEAARRIRNALDCCVRYTHHTGKQNARDKTADQYSGRGGSALPDGSRMVAVLQPLTTEEWAKATGTSLADGETGMALALPKLSYCPPQPDILITRKGYAFVHTRRAEIDAPAALAANCDQIIRALEHDLGNGVQHTKNSLEALKLMPRPDLRDALSTLTARGRVVSVRTTRKGGPQYFLQPQASPSSAGEPSTK